MDHASPQQVETVRTCQNCAHAKIRCLRSQPAGACDRCRRLRKDCVFRPARRRFGGGGGGSGGGSAHHPALPLPGSAATTTTTTASIGDGLGNGAAAAAANEGSQQQLASIEAKLDRLLSLHGGNGSSTGQASSSTNFYNAPPSSSSPASSYNPPTVPASCSSTTTAAVHPPPAARSSSIAGASTHSSAGGDVIDDDIISLQQAQRYIQLYRTALTPHFPFVVLDNTDGDDDDDAVVQRLRRERPVLFLAVVTAASFEDVGVQRECGRRLREVVGERVAGRGGGRGRRNCGVDVDFLMGLLVGLAW